MYKRIATLFLLVWGVAICSPASAAIVVSEFFTGRIQSFDEVTGAESNFATIGGNPGLSGLAFSQSTNTLYATALNHGGVYRFDARTGSLLGFSSLGIGPGGIAVSATGEVYVTDFTSSSVRIYDATLSNLLETITTPTGPTSGVGFLANGNALIATTGGGVFVYDGTNVNLFSGNPAASAQIATDPLGNTFIGHGLGFSDSVFRYDATGNLMGTIDISAAMINSTGNGSSMGTSPSGVTLDADGNLFISVLGQSNPGDPGGERGGLFKFDVNGNLLDTFAAGSNAYSSIAYINVVPEPSAVWLVAVSALAAVSRRKRRPSSLSHANSHKTRTINR